MRPVHVVICFFLFLDFKLVFAEHRCPLNQVLKFFENQPYEVLPPIEHRNPTWLSMLSGSGGPPSQNLFGVSSRIYQLEPDLSFTRFDQSVRSFTDDYSPSLGFYEPHTYGNAKPYFVQLKSGKKFKIPIQPGEAIMMFGNFQKIAWNADYSVQLMLVTSYNKNSNKYLSPVLIKIIESDQGLKMLRLPFQFPGKADVGLYLRAYPLNNGKAAYITDGTQMGRLDLNTGEFKEIVRQTDKGAVPVVFIGRVAPGGGEVEHVRDGHRLYLDFESEKILEMGPVVSKKLEKVKLQYWEPDVDTWFRVRREPGSKRNAAYFNLKFDQYFEIPHAGINSNFGVISSDNKKVFGNNLFEGADPAQPFVRDEMGLSWLDVESGIVQKLPIKVDYLSRSLSVSKVLRSDPGYLILLEDSSQSQPSRILLLSQDGKKLSEVIMPFESKNVNLVLNGRAALARTGKNSENSLGSIVSFRTDQVIELEKNTNNQFLLHSSSRPKLDQIVFPEKPWSPLLLEKMNQTQASLEELMEAMAYLKQGGCKSHPAYIGKVFVSILGYSNVLFSKVVEEYGGCAQFLPKTDWNQVGLSDQASQYLETRFKQIAKKEASLPKDFIDLSFLKPFIEALPIEKREKLASYLAGSFASKFSGRNTDSLTPYSLHETLEKWSLPIAKKILGLKSNSLKFESLYIPFDRFSDAIEVYAVSTTDFSGFKPKKADLTFDKEYIEPLGFWVGRKKINLDLSEKDHTIRWFDEPKSPVTQLSLGKLTIPKREFLDAPPYSKMLQDQKLVGLIVKDHDPSLLAEYLDYFKEQGFKFTAEEMGGKLDQKNASTMAHWTLEKIQSGEIDYWVKDAHGSPETSQTFTSLASAGTVYRGAKSSNAMTSEEVYIFEPKDFAGKVSVESKTLNKALELRKATRAGPILYFNTTCNSSNSVCSLYGAMDSHSILMIPSTNSVETFFNGSQSGVKQLIDGVRQQKSFAEIRKAVESKGGSAESFLFPDRDDYFDSLQGLKNRHEIEVRDFNSGSI